MRIHLKIDNFVKDREVPWFYQNRKT